MKKTLAKVISGTMCALVAVMLPIYTAKAAGPKVKNVVMEDSPRYFYVGEDYYRFELIFEGGLESYSWTYLDTQFTVGINVEMVDRVKQTLQKICSQAKRQPSRNCMVYAMHLHMTKPNSCILRPIGIRMEFSKSKIWYIS